MQTQVRPPRTRSSGGRTLMLLGLVLALAAAAIVFYITTSVQGTFGQTTESVVVARTTLKPGTILTITPNPHPSYMLTTDAFGFVPMNKNAVPDGAIHDISQDALNAILSDQIVVQQFLQGDVLRTNDPRLAQLGTAPGNSVAAINPNALKNGQVLVLLASGNNGSVGLQQGDTIDIIASIPVVLKNGQHEIVTQTTLTNVLIYAVDTPAKGDVWVVLSNQDVLYVQEMVASGFVLSIVIRKPGDPTDPSGANPQGGANGNDQPTTPVDDNDILNHFGFNPPPQ